MNFTSDRIQSSRPRFFDIQVIHRERFGTMVYIMVMKVDGGCRYNGLPGAIGAAAAINILKWGRRKLWAEALPEEPIPTNSRAELTAIILALSKAIERHRNLVRNPRLRLTVYSDSDYAVKCMNVWVQKWCRNGWRTAAGAEVKNKDLIQRALDLANELREKGSVRFFHIPREQNREADALCNSTMNEMERIEISRLTSGMDSLSVW